MARLVAYSLVSIVPPPFKTEYIVGIAEEDGERIPVRIERSNLNILKIGMPGLITTRKTDQGEFQYFIPEEVKVEGGKIALVTGASRGIGKAITLELAKRGYDIALNDLEESSEVWETLRQVQSLGRRTIFTGADVSSYSEVQRMVDTVVKEFGKIDVLVNNAGINIDRLVTNMTAQEWQRVIDVNLTGVFNCTKAVLPHMIAAGGGRIINISSQGALDGPVGQANYAAAKGGVISFTKVIAREYAQYNILCNAVAPGCIRTRMTDSMPPGQLQERILKIPLGRRGEPEEVAKLVAFLAEDGTYITGQLIMINAGEYI
ncbi:MAG: SDR family oxidoreductase [Candidatus Bathyarchaeia archaeon]